MQTDTRDNIETYRQTTSVNLLILHNAGPRSQPLFIINCTISGIPINMMIKSAVARFIMKILVTDCRIFLSSKMTMITRLLPMRPTVPIPIKRMDNKTITSSEAGSGGIGEKLDPLISISPTLLFKLGLNPYPVVERRTKSSMRFSGVLKS